MIQKDGKTNLAKANLEEVFKCGDCLHHKQTPHRQNKRVCAEEGIRTFAVAPKCFTPDYTKVIGNTDEFMAAVTFYGSRTPQQRKILLGMLRQQPKGRKIAMGTRLYLNIRGREYIDNYVCGFAVGYTSGGDLVLCGDPDAKARGRVFFAYLRSESSLLTQKEWRAKYTDLKTRGRISDPSVTGKRDITDVVKEDTYEIPTIDQAPKELVGRRSKKGDDGKINKRTSSLVQILTF